MTGRDLWGDSGVTVVNVDTGDPAHGCAFSEEPLLVESGAMRLDAEIGSRSSTTG